MIEGDQTQAAGGGGAGGQPSEEELRAALEQELKRLTVDDILLQTIVSLLNLGGRRAGLAPGTEDERDLAQVQTAIDGARGLLPLLERGAGPERSEDLNAIRDALAQLQMAYAKLSTEEPAPAPGDQGGGPAAEGDESAPEEGAKAEEDASKPGPAQSSGRLWVPGQ